MSPTSPYLVEGSNTVTDSFVCGDEAMIIGKSHIGPSIGSHIKTIGSSPTPDAIASGQTRDFIMSNEATSAIPIATTLSSQLNSSFASTPISLPQIDPEALPSSSLVLASWRGTASPQPKTTSQVHFLAQKSATTPNKLSGVVISVIGGVLGGLGALLVMFFVAIWMLKCGAPKERPARIGHDAERVQIDLAICADHVESEKRTAAIYKEEDEETSAEPVFRPRTGLVSNRTTIASDRATVGAPHPSPSRPSLRFDFPPPLPPWPPQIPAPAYFTWRREETDGGVRLLAGNGLSRFQSAGSSSSDAADESSLPPPYQSRY